MSTYKHFVRAALAEVKAFDAAYEAEVNEWYTEGRGRSRADGGMGYTFPHCPHGMSRWTDYDNICGHCEDGLTAIQRAQSIARNRYREFRLRTDWVLAAPASYPADLRRALVEYATDALPKF